MLLHSIAYFVAGAFFINALPHAVSGVMGRPFQSPFAKPPGVGLSSSQVNVWWAAANLAVAYGLTWHVGQFDVHAASDADALGLGALAMALMLARTFGRLHGGDLHGPA